MCSPIIYISIYIHVLYATQFIIKLIASVTTVLLLIQAVLQIGDEHRYCNHLHTYLYKSNSLRCHAEIGGSGYQ